MNQWYLPGVNIVYACACSLPCLNKRMHECNKFDPSSSIGRHVRGDGGLSCISKPLLAQCTQIVFGTNIYIGLKMISILKMMSIFKTDCPILLRMGLKSSTRLLSHECRTYSHK